MDKRLLVSLAMALVTSASFAQISNTLSPYSQFGLGNLSDQSVGFNRGMSGLGIGWRDGKTVNVINPASYSAIDSLTMIFDAGVIGQITNFSENGTKRNKKTGDFDYFVSSFRLLPKVGVGFGVIPYSSIGYSYSNQSYISENNHETYNTQTNTGDGGFSQAFVGAGWEFVKGLSVGFNFSYFWGKYDKLVTVISNDTYVNTLTKTYSTSVSSYKLDFGLQYQQRLNKDNLLTLGATVGLGHNLGAKASMINANTNNVTSVSTVSTDSVMNAFDLPFTFGVGATIAHKNHLVVGIDYALQKWGSLDYPSVNSKTKAYENTSGILRDRHKVTIGADWIPNANSRRLYNRIHYRGGLSYATPYYNIGGNKGPKEITLSGGFAIPLTNSWNNRSVLNITAQWVHLSAQDFIKENTFRLTIGLTFNERWFAKWKVD